MGALIESSKAKALYEEEKNALSLSFSSPAIVKNLIRRSRKLRVPRGISHHFIRCFLFPNTFF